MKKIFSILVLLSLCLFAFAEENFTINEVLNPYYRSDAYMARMLQNDFEATLSDKSILNKHFNVTELYNLQNAPSLEYAQSILGEVLGEMLFCRKFEVVMKSPSDPCPFGADIDDIFDNTGKIKPIYNILKSAYKKVIITQDYHINKWGWEAECRGTRKGVDALKSLYINGYTEDSSKNLNAYCTVNTAAYLWGGNKSRYGDVSFAHILYCAPILEKMRRDTYKKLLSGDYKIYRVVSNGVVEPYKDGIPLNYKETTRLLRGEGETGKKEPYSYGVTSYTDNPEIASNFSAKGTVFDLQIPIERILSFCYLDDWVWQISQDQREYLLLDKGAYYF